MAHRTSDYYQHELQKIAISELPREVTIVLLLSTHAEIRDLYKRFLHHVILKPKTTQRL